MIREVGRTVVFLLLPSCVGVWPSAPAAAGKTNPAEWLVLRGRRVEVVGRPGDSTGMRRILAHLEGAPPLPGLPEGLPTGVRVVLAPSRAVWDSLAGGAPPEWSAALALPSRNLILLPAFSRADGGRSPWEEARILRHEWAHLALYQWTGGLQAPMWFEEGYAQWASGGWGGGEGWRLRIAFALRRAPPLDSVSLDWPRDRRTAEVAYLLAATAMEYLVRESGERGLEVFLRRWVEKGNFPEAFQEVFGWPVDRFETAWRRYVRRRYGWLFVLSHSTVFWLFLGLVLLGLVRVRRHRNRLALARLRAGEPPDRPDFWKEPERPAGPPGD